MAGQINEAIKAALESLEIGTRAELAALSCVACHPWHAAPGKNAGLRASLSVRQIYIYDYSEPVASLSS